MKPERFTFRQDDACHWYLVPVRRLKAWDKWYERGYPDGKVGAEMEGYRVDGCPAFYSFENPERLP
jgi:hypothetical protein